MKKTKVLFPVLLLATCLVSCNKSTSLKRVSFATATEAKASEIHSAMKAAQEKEGATIFKKGTMKCNYNITVKGNFRNDELTYDNINFSSSGNYDMSWSLDDKYIKLVGSNETIYFKVLEGNNGTECWKYGDFKVGNETKSYKFDWTTTYLLYDSFNDFVIDTIDQYSNLTVPSLISIGGGITGLNQHVLPEGTGLLAAFFSFEPDTFFDADFKAMVKELETKYKDDKTYHVSLDYGAKSDGTGVSSNFKGKINAADYHTSKRSGAVDFDIFAAYQNNYLLQAEYNIESQIINTRLNNLNLDMKFYFSEDLVQDVCNVDSIEYNKYVDYDKTSL